MADAAEETPKWVAVQRKTFVKWTNTHLKRKGFGELGVETVSKEFDTGEKLMEVMNAIFDVAIPKHAKNPKLRPQKMDVIAQAFKMIEEAQVKTNFLQVEHLLDGNEKMILGLLWSIILEYAISGISVDEATAKEGLLLWVQKRTKNYNHVDPPGVKNFSTNWSDGMAFCALIHRYRPSMIDYDNLDPKDAAGNLEKAFTAAEELGIPRLLDVEDLTESVRPDERSVMTQVSEYFRVMAGDSLKENAAQRLANFVKFMREIEDRQNDYVARARALIEWCNAEAAKLGEHNFGETLEDATAALNNYRAFVVEQKPAKVGERLDIEQLFAEIQTELAVNQRFAFVPPEDVSPDAVQTAFDSLVDAEKEHAKAVRDNRFKYVERKETEVPAEKKEEIAEAFRHFDKNGSDTLDKIEFKAALMALSVPVRDDEELQTIFDRVREGNEHISFDQYLRYNLSLIEDKDTPEQTNGAFQLLSDGAQGVTKDQLLVEPLTEEDVDFLLAKMGAQVNEDGTYDFATFVNGHFKAEE